MRGLTLLAGNGLAGLVEGDPQHQHLEAHAVGGCLAHAARHAADAATAGQGESDVRHDDGNVDDHGEVTVTMMTTMLS